MKSLLATAILLGCLLIDIARSGGLTSVSYRGRRRRVAGAHRNRAGVHAPRALLSGLHRPDMYGKVSR